MARDVRTRVSTNISTSFDQILRLKGIKSGSISGHPVARASDSSARRPSAGCQASPTLVWAAPGGRSSLLVTQQVQQA